MRKISKQLAIVASVFSLISFIFIILTLIEIISTQTNDDLSPISITIVLVTVLTNAAGGIMGLIAAMIVTKKHTTAGIMMIICSVFCLINMLITFSIIHVISMALFVTASVFALKPERLTAISPQPNVLAAPKPARKPGKILSIIGGSFALAAAILIFVSNMGYIAANPHSFENSSMSKALSIFSFMVPAIVNVIVGILGLTASLIINKRHTAAGVMMIIGAVICIFGFFNVISMVLLIIASVFAVKPDQPASAPPQPALPYIPPDELSP